jgi:hypothetical protein
VPEGLPGTNGPRPKGEHRPSSPNRPHGPHRPKGPPGPGGGQGKRGHGSQQHRRGGKPQGTAPAANDNRGNEAPRTVEPGNVDDDAGNR